MTDQDWLAIATELTAQFEAPGGPRLTSYIVPGEEHLQATIGLGTAIPLAKHPMMITKEEAYRLLSQGIHSRYQLIAEACPHVWDRMTACQKASAVSWAYNCKGWYVSDTFKLLVAGKIDEFFVHAATWYHGEGKSIMAGLVRRRAVELHLGTRGEIDRITGELNWYMDLIPTINAGMKAKKNGHLVWKGDRLIWQLS